MKQQSCYILAIESSCDDTAAAILRNDEVLSNIIATQDIHKAYGGVVPELASRAHQQNIIPVVDQALKKAGVSKKTIKCNCLHPRSWTFRIFISWNIFCQIFKYGSRNSSY